MERTRVLMKPDGIQRTYRGSQSVLKEKGLKLMSYKNDES